MALMLSVFSSGLLQTVPAFADAPGNNGTLKIMDATSKTEAPNNEPKVCSWYYEGFSFDSAQAGRIEVEGQGQTDYSPVVVANVTTTAEGYFKSPVQSLPEGHYKATLFEKPIEGKGEKSKSKVFWVECDDEQSEKPRLTVCESWESSNSTNNDLNGWTLSSGAEYVDGGMKLTSTGDWNEATITRTLSGELADLGTGITFTPGTQYLGLHVETSAGTLVYEQEPTYGGKWWSTANFNVASGMGYATFDTLENIVAANPDVTLNSLTVLYTSPTAASTTVTSVKIGCVEYTFDKADREPTVCTVSNNRYIQPWEYGEATYPDVEDYEGSTGMIANNATYEFKEDGLHLSTPDVDSSVYGLIDAGNTPLQDVDKMSYETFRKTESAGYANTLPAYILVVDTNGSDVAGGISYLFYEPYNNMPPAVIEGSWQTWDAINDGEAKWWMSGTGQTLRTWDYFVEQFSDAVVIAYGFNQGSYNAETYSIIQDLEFDCAITSFAAPGRGNQQPEVPEVPVDNGNVLGDNTGKVPATTTASLPATLPATGSVFNPMMILIASLAAYGAAYFAQGRRRVTEL